MSDVAFAGFGSQSLKFLKALAFHQNREWFHENKAIYEREVRGPMGDLVEILAARFDKAKIPLRGDRRNSLYRVNRDVRFSNNKDPYVTHASAILTRSGTKKDNGFCYMHYANERCFIAAGFYGLEGARLKAMRQAIVDRQKAFAAIVSKLERQGYALELDSALKRHPRGFETVSGEKLSTWVRLRNQVFVEELTPEIFQSPELADRMFTLAERAMPLLDFGWKATDGVL
ncbi:MAG: TIGR02453 family protein [Nitratireductor sp.]|nr:TIGR02453 family protein [Nitratireductor sp.]